MTRAPNWDEHEFETLLSNAKMSDEDLAKLLPRRSLGAIGVVRSGIHSFHRGLDVSMLSRIVLDRLQDGPGPVVCPICGAKIVS